MTPPTPEALARVLRERCKKWLAERSAGHPDLYPDEEELIQSLATAALAALTPAPSSVHGFSATTNTPAPAQGERELTIEEVSGAVDFGPPPPPEPEGEVSSEHPSIRDACKEIQGRFANGSGCHCDVLRDAVNAALARARGK